MARGRMLVGAACCYELVALATGLPTISALCRRHRAAEAVLLAVLLAHLHRPVPVSQPSPPVRHGKDIP